MQSRPMTSHFMLAHTLFLHYYSAHGNYMLVQYLFRLDNKIKVGLSRKREVVRIDVIIQFRFTLDRLGMDRI